MKYSTSTSGITLSGNPAYDNSQPFFPWQPSTWPSSPAHFNIAFLNTLKMIFEGSMLSEIENVIQDALRIQGNLEHRGHVVALAMLCVIDAIASYGYRGGVGVRYRAYIQNHFPTDYQVLAADIYKLYRNSEVHSWNLFEVGILPGNEPVQKNNGTIYFGLLHFFEALKTSVTHFLKTIQINPTMQQQSINRYAELKSLAKP